MPKAPVKRRLRDMALPVSKRTKISYGFQETPSVHIESDNTCTLGKAVIGMKQDKKTTVGSADIHKLTLGLKTNIVTHLESESNSPIISNDKLTAKSSYHQSHKSSAKVYKKYGCKLCWRRFQLKSHAYRHKQKAHKVQKAPMQCASCSCVFEDLTGNGTWNDCCMAILRNHFILRTIM